MIAYWRLGVLVTLALLLSEMSFGQGRSQTAPGYTEAQIKAAFIVHLTSFVSWPNNAPATVICLAERDGTFGALESLLQNKADRGLTLKKLDPLSPKAGCDVMYFNAEGADENWGSSPASVLLIGDRVGFAEAGGMVELRRVSNRIRLLVNPVNIENSGLKANSRLLSLATVVGEEAGQ